VGKLPTSDRRQLVAELYVDERRPIGERSSRALGKRFGVSHRTILNDLAALGIEERLAKPPAGGISKAERQRRVRELYPTHTCAEVAELLGCSHQTIKRDVHELGLDVRKPAPRRKHPELPERPCDCGCGETFKPTRVGERFKDWDHYLKWKRDQVEEVAAEARPMYDGGLTLDEIAAARPELPSHRVRRSLQIVGTTMRPARRRPIHRCGRFVKCKARDHAFCPHGETERWISTSHLKARRAEFLSAACWAQYRKRFEWRSLLPLIASRTHPDLSEVVEQLVAGVDRPGAVERALEMWDGRSWGTLKRRAWKNRINSLKKRGVRYTHEQRERAIRMLLNGRSIRATAAAAGLTKHQVEDLKAGLQATAEVSP
jgi:hypothetical protein